MRPSRSAKRIGIALSAALLAAPTLPALAGENGDCTCRANGKDVPEGQTVCLNLPSGPVLARCEMVLNNTAWKTIQTGCPSASLVENEKLFSPRG